MNKIQTILKEQYNLAMANVVPQKGGWAALAYKVYNNEHIYFLKMYEKNRASTPKWTALIDKYVPILLWLMQNSDLKGKLPVPLLTKQGAYKCEDEEGIYLLYEYIEGDTIGDKELTGEQVRQLSEIISDLHLYGEDIPIDTDAVKEDFVVPFLQQLRDLLNKEPASPIPGEVSQVIKPYLEPLQGLIGQVDKLSADLKSSQVRMALCHTDLHRWNLMQSGQQLILIDWEGLKLAPVEADMMFLTDKPYFAEFKRIYMKAHPHYVINPVALRFYQGRRKLEDIWEFIEQLIFDTQDAQERSATLNYLLKELKEIRG